MLPPAARCRYRGSFSTAAEVEEEEEKEEPAKWWAAARTAKKW
jgi:hypothetical protein